ncbi:hypothetical protein ABB37_03667 [Leptomonas pyrrhocoris]|uniref:B30.2/SPRY domain-containing protein n=1 Tax=Leptomonas pyrrhocoris TaxID=157538 RepID=A0A0M9G2T2_LEPPY|nr:hypothetical protein ABB37_03667 [Leptomonas pyrrhocoris]KPA81250.1 hypothetical protein ABB37_03667 [Leptomonas pyrrhocoris]|eukprot:XP_015659689.1 hypothetical protein ABB37_03667 [Leptomonas pyrrhocoris]
MSALANRTDQRSSFDRRTSLARRSTVRDVVASIAYVPATAESVKSVTFEWARACSIYTIQGANVWHQGGGELPYRPVLGSLAMQPNTGKHFFSYRINTDNSRAGFCTSTVYNTPESFRENEFGKTLGADLDDSASCAEDTDEVPQPSFLQTIGAVPIRPSSPWEAYIDLQTSKVYVNGRCVKHLWRLFVPTCGGVLSFVVDTELGAVQLFVDGKYEGMMLDESTGLKGKTVYPCIGISGQDVSNRSIGTGYMGAFVEPSHPFNCIY